LLTYPNNGRGREEERKGERERGGEGRKEGEDWRLQA
jgi:hypothetical protein